MCCVCRQCYRTHCQRWCLNCSAITCRVNMNILIVRQRWGICSPLSSRSRWSSSEDWDKYLTPNYRNSHVLSAYSIGSSENLWCGSCVSSVESVEKLPVSIGTAVLPALPQQALGGLHPSEPHLGLAAALLLPDISCGTCTGLQGMGGSCVGEAAARSARELCFTGSCK